MLLVKWLLVEIFFTFAFQLPWAKSRILPFKLNFPRKNFAVNMHEAISVKRYQEICHNSLNGVANNDKKQK